MYVSMYNIWLNFFFRAEDGIRYGHVTGVQTCALPIYHFLSITQMTTKAAAGFVLLLLALLTCSCADSVDSSGFEQGGPAIITPGNSIEGIQLGDSRERVEELLVANRDVGLVSGPYRAWGMFNYEDGLSVMLDRKSTRL